MAEEQDLTDPTSAPVGLDVRDSHVDYSCKEAFHLGEGHWLPVPRV